MPIQLRLADETPLRPRRRNRDIVDFQLFRDFRGKGPAYLRSIKGLCQQLGLPIGFFGRRRWYLSGPEAR